MHVKGQPCASLKRKILLWISLFFAGFCHVKPDVISLASRFQKVESRLTSKAVLGETQFKNLKENNTSQVNETLSGYAAFMRAFRNFHETTVQFVFSYWPAAKNTTRDLLSYVRLDGVGFNLRS